MIFPFLKSCPGCQFTCFFQKDGIETISVKGIAVPDIGFQLFPLLFPGIVLLLLTKKPAHRFRICKKLQQFSHIFFRTFPYFQPFRLSDTPGKPIMSLIDSLKKERIQIFQALHGIVCLIDRLCSGMFIINHRQASGCCLPGKNRRICE